MNSAPLVPVSIPALKLDWKWTALGLDFWGLCSNVKCFFSPCPILFPLLSRMHSHTLHIHITHTHTHTHTLTLTPIHTCTHVITHSHTHGKCLPPLPPAVPSVRSYGMFASVSCVLQEAMASHLDSIVRRMIESLQSDEGVTVSTHLNHFQELPFPPRVCQEPGSHVPRPCGWVCGSSCLQVHYTSSEVPFLDFDDGDEEDQGMAENLEDNEGIEG